MATVIDELVVVLGLDPKNFTKGQQEALKQFKNTQNQATRTRLQLEAEGSRAAEGFFGKLKGEALGLFAVLTGANSLKDFVAAQVSSISATDRMAKAAGMGLSDLSMFGNVIEANGGKAESAKSSLAGLAQVMEDWRTFKPPGAEMLMAMSRIGAGPQDQPLTVFEKFAKWSEGKDPRLVAQTGNLLGFDEAATNEAMKGLTQVMKDFADAKARGLPDDEDARKVRALQTAFKGLSQEITAVGRNLIVDLAPALTTVLGTTTTAMQGAPASNRFGVMAGPMAWVGALFNRPEVKRWLIAHGADPAAFGGGGGATPSAAPVAGPVAASRGGQGGGIEAALRRAGLDEAHIRGVAAGIFAEGGAVGAVNPKSGAFGIGQWLGARKAALFAKYGPNPTLDQQIAFLVGELRGGDRGGKSVLGASGDANVLGAYITQFMRPARGRETTGDLSRGARYLGLSGGAGLAAGGGALITGNTTNVHIDRITVDASGARDGHEVGRHIGGALRSDLTAQANAGLSG